MKRRLFILAAAFSLTLFIATAVMWVLSYFPHDDLVHTGPRHVLNITSKNGRLFLQFGSTAFVMYSPAARGRWSRGSILLSSGHPLAYGPHGWRLLGFDLNNFGPAGPYRQTVRDIAVPYWFVCLLTALAPLQLLRMWRRARTRQRGRLCLTCGYDLRATPQGGRCPECGTLSPANAKAAA